jgi:hypothetical protein
LKEVVARGTAYYFSEHKSGKKKQPKGLSGSLTKRTTSGAQKTWSVPGLENFCGDVSAVERGRSRASAD